MQGKLEDTKRWRDASWLLLIGNPAIPVLCNRVQIHTRTMSCERGIRFELLARLCPNSTGAVALAMPAHLSQAEKNMMN